VIYLAVYSEILLDRLITATNKSSNKIASSSTKFELGTFQIHVYCITVSPTCFYLIEWHIMSHHATQTVDKSRQCYGPWSITVAPHLIASATTTYELEKNHWLLLHETKILMVLSIRLQFSGM
jgi:hypothetical protein